ncbi:MAG: hypothetical protein IJV24_08295 [Prevotella sp.]|nr:hypothetical protein [Prevotella sp.]
MKKFLTLSFATAMVAMTASAQLASTSYAKEFAMSEGMQLQKATTAINYAPVAKPAAAHKAPALNDMAGIYILNSDNFDATFRASNEFTLSLENGTTKVCDEDFADTEDFTYNVVLYDFSYTGAKAYGYYYESDGMIVVPCQTIATNSTYGRIVLTGVVTNNGTPKTYGFDIALEVKDDGSLELFDNAEALEEAGFEKGSIISGWYSVLPDSEDGGAWNFGFSCEIFKPNATMNYATTARALGGTGSGWERVQKRVAIEDYESEYVVNNFLGLCPISIEIDGENCSMPFAQQVDDYNYTTYANDGNDYGFMRIWGCVIDGNSIGRDYDKEALKGFVGEEGMEFYKLEWKDAWEEDGETYEAGYYYIDTDPDYVRYFCVATNAGPEGAYTLGWCCNLSIAFDSAESEGINEVSNTVKSSANYNLLGQRVLQSKAKGIMVRDGKKFFTK